MSYDVHAEAHPQLKLKPGVDSFTMVSGFRTKIVLRRATSSIATDPGRPTSPIPSQLAPVEIRVLGDNGGVLGQIPLLGAKVKITQQGRQVAFGKTDLQGVFRTSLRPNATYQVSAEAHPLLKLNPATNTFRLGSSYETTIVLRGSNSPRSGQSPMGTAPSSGGSSTQLGQLQLQVINKHNRRPVEDAQIVIRQYNKSVSVKVQEVMAGSYRVSLSPGRYQVTISSAGYAKKTVNVSVRRTQPNRYTIDLDTTLQ